MNICAYGMVSEGVDWFYLAMMEATFSSCQTWNITRSASPMSWCAPNVMPFLKPGISRLFTLPRICSTSCQYGLLTATAHAVTRLLLSRDQPLPIRQPRPTLQPSLTGELTHSASQSAAYSPPVSNRPPRDMLAELQLLKYYVPVFALIVGYIHTCRSWNITPPVAWKTNTPDPPTKETNRQIGTRTNKQKKLPRHEYTAVFSLCGLLCCVSRL